MIKPTEEDRLKLNNDNYYDTWSRERWISFHDFTAFTGTPALVGCEERALAERCGNWFDEKGVPLFVGGYLDAKVEGTLDKYIEENKKEILTAKGELKAPFKQAELMYERISKDELFMKTLSGEKQKIVAEYVPELDCYCRAKLDSYIPHVAIVDLKTSADIRKPIKTKDGWLDFVSAYSYTRQLAWYQRLVEIETGEKLPVFISVVTKSDNPDIEVINIPQDVLDEEWQKVIDNIDRVKALIDGTIEPVRCGRCNYCLATKKLSKPIGLDGLFWDF